MNISRRKLREKKPMSALEVRIWEINKLPFQKSPQSRANTNRLFAGK
jgi:hypothetical protein